MLASGLVALVLGAVAGEPEHRTWTVDGVAREALVCAPAEARTRATPVVFVFHGYGGDARGIAGYLPIHTLWPEALVVYMQGLPIAGRVGGVERNGAGWQNLAGDQGDRDLRFFDAALDSLRSEYKVDEMHVYAAGHSNGGGFVYLLWAMRPYAFDAFAPCAAVPLMPSRLTPKPVLHVAGQKDEIVKIAWQAKALEGLRRLNRCDARGQPWGTNATLYASNVGAPVVALVHPGGHELSPEAPQSIVRFFKDRAQAGTAK